MMSSDNESNSSSQQPSIRNKKIQIISDVHTEFGVKPDAFAAFLAYADITVLAGDIVNSAAKLTPYLRICKQFSKHVVFICGNHEYYGRDSSGRRSTDLDYEQVCSAIEGVVFLQRARVQIDDVWFCGATLWSDVTDIAKRSLNDPFPASKIREMHATDRKWLQENVELGDIVVTHHLPSLQLIHSKYAGSPANSAFATDLEAVLEERKPALWCCGHTHTPFDVVIKDVRVIVNPVGYPHENDSFDIKIVDLPFSPTVVSETAAVETKEATAETKEGTGTKEAAIDGSSALKGLSKE